MAQNFLSHGQNNRTQPIGADMRLGQEQDLRRSAQQHQLLEDRSAAGIPDAGGQLAVGECAGAAFAELDIRLWIQRAAAPEAGNILLPPFHRLAPFDQQWTQTGQRQVQGGKKPGRAGADYDDPVFRCRTNN